MVYKTEDLLEKLKSMLSSKKSAGYYAKKLGIHEQEVRDLLHTIKLGKIKDRAETATYVTDLEDKVVSLIEDVENNKAELTFKSQSEIKTLDELIERAKIDTTKWNITKYVQNYWGNSNTPHWQVKAWMSAKNGKEVFQESFTEFLKQYTPCPIVKGAKVNNFKASGTLILNKQDSHLNKHDIDGNNDMIGRMVEIKNKIQTIVEQASLGNNLEKIVYILGSDEFNSEYTNTTTKGTPQSNLSHDFHETFQKICDFEIGMIESLLEKCSYLEIVYVAGNHDEFVGWHMINWLRAYFRNQVNLTFDCQPAYRKYISYGNSALMFNHGDAIKPAKLAAMFPIEFREKWSEHEHFYIFTGDKHHEVSHDFNGIKFYQIPAFSNAKSVWDDKHGWTCSKAEVTGFLIEKFNGMTNIFKQYL